MTQIIKGGNLGVAGQVWRVGVVRGVPGDGVPEVDTSALLLDASGRVRDDGDLVFYNRLSHATGAVRHAGRVAGEGRTVADWLEIDTGRVEPAVQRIVIAASCDGGTFGQVPGLYLRALSAATGAQLALYEVDDATTETAFVLGEFYRRDGGWKFRAVGQGYDSGLIGLATDFGIEGKDTPDPEREPEYLPGPAAEPVAQPAPAPAAVGVAEAPAAEAPPVATGPEPLIVGKAAGAPAAGGEGDIPAPRDAAAGDRRKEKGFGGPWGFGGDFPEFVRSGKGRTDITVDVPVPPGFVLVDAERAGEGYFSVHTLNHRRRNDHLLFNTGLDDFSGRSLLDHDGRTPLRLRVDAAPGAEWTVAVRPVSAVDPLGAGAEGRGADVLLHTGPAADLLARLRGEGDGSVYFHVHGYEPDANGHLVVNEADERVRTTVALPEGPLLLAVHSAEGRWSLEVRPKSGGAQARSERGGRFWRRGSR